MITPTRLAAFTLCLALLAGCARGPAPLEPQTAATSLKVPFPTSLYLNGENVTFTGTVHLTARCGGGGFTPVDPCRFHTNLARVEGVGQTTGLSYRATGASSHSFSEVPPGSYQFVAAYRLVPPNPIREGISLAFEVTLGEGGAIGEVSVGEAVY